MVLGAAARAARGRAGLADLASAPAVGAEAVAAVPVEQRGGVGDQAAVVLGERRRAASRSAEQRGRRAPPARPRTSAPPSSSPSSSGSPPPPARAGPARARRRRRARPSRPATTARLPGRRCAGDPVRVAPAGRDAVQPGALERVRRSHGPHGSLPRCLAGPPSRPSRCRAAASIHVPGRGELFVRDTRRRRPAVLLLHGWMFCADLNWYPLLRAARRGRLPRAGASTTAATGEGCARPSRSAQGLRRRRRGAPRPSEDPARARGRLLMGGPIASLLARNHPELVSGVVLGATALDWSGRRMRTFWRTMAGLRLAMGFAPESFWQRGLKAGGFPESRSPPGRRRSCARQLDRHR